MARDEKWSAANEKAVCEDGPTDLRCVSAGSRMWWFRATCGPFSSDHILVFSFAAAGMETLRESGLFFFWVGVCFARLELLLALAFAVAARRRGVSLHKRRRRQKDACLFLRDGQKRRRRRRRKPRVGTGVKQDKARTSRCRLRRLIEREEAPAGTSNVPSGRGMEEEVPARQDRTVIGRSPRIAFGPVSPFRGTWQRSLLWA